jgi:predicted nucleotidyltransferase
MSILNSIKKTIEYGQKYGGKLTKEQLFERLIGDQIYKKEEIKKSLNPSVLRTSPFDKKEIFAKEKREKAENLAKLLNKKFKDILFLGVTGSVAAGYPKIDDDIDLIIITKINKLWINRLKLRFFVLVNRIPHRKYGQKENKDEFCFNLWIDEGVLKLPKSRRNLRSAVDLILVKPIINKNNTYEKFILENDWAKKWVATGYNEKISNVKYQTLNIKEKNIFFNVIVNWLIFWPQYWYMKRRIKKEKIGLHEAFFHH